MSAGALNERLPLKPEEMFESAKIREKLKANRTPAVKKSNVEIKRGPLIAKHPSTLHLNPDFAANKEQRPGLNGWRECRTQSPTFSKGPEDGGRYRQRTPRKGSPVVPRSRSSSPPISLVRCRPWSFRRGSPCPSRSRSPSPVSSAGSRSSSPMSSSGSVDGLYIELAKQRVEKVRRSRLYLLRQPGPNSFLVAGDSPAHRYKVVIGPQTCSCNSRRPCIHLLFVMVRAFQVNENDPRLWSKTLKNFEVETLFANYEKQRRVRAKDDNSRNREAGTGNETAARRKNEQGNNINANCQDEELCPICLLEMVDGESLVICMKGCRNKLHHHCIAIWANECASMNEPILCPLCRAEWSPFSEDTCCSSIPPSKFSLHAPYIQREINNNQISGPSVQPNCAVQSRERRPSSSAPIPAARHSLSSNSPTTPVAKVTEVPAVNLKIAEDQERRVQVFGQDLVSCLNSKQWVVRETALKRLSCELFSRLGSDPWLPQSPCSVSPVVQQCCDILADMATDPVYKVYLASLKCLRTLLTCFCSRFDGSVATVADMLKPVMHSILLRCAGATKRFSKLSIDILVEICKGQDGGLGLGIRTGHPDKRGFGGIDYVLGCVFDNKKKTAVSWQGWLGRLYLLERLMQEFPKEFTIPYNPILSVIQQSDQYSRLTNVLNFTAGAMESGHVAVSRHAQKVYLVGAELSKRVHSVFALVCDMVSSIDVSLYQRLKKKLWATLREGHSGAWNQAFLPNKCDVTRWPDFLASWDELTWCKRPKEQKQVVHEDAVFKKPVAVNKRPNQLSLSAPTSPPSGREPLKSRGHNSEPSTPSGKHRQITTCKLVGNEQIKVFNDTSGSRKRSEGNWPLVLRRDSGISTWTKSSEENNRMSPREEMRLDLKRLASTAVQQNHKKPIKEVTTPRTPGAPCPSPVVGVIPLRNSGTAYNSNHEQSDLPFIPGLMDVCQVDSGIFLENEESYCPESVDIPQYVEDVHWTRGHKLGSGAFSICYEARDSLTGTLMAIKQVLFPINSPEEQDKVIGGIRDEIGMMSRLDHPNIVRILGATQQYNQINMFVELMTGGSVARLLYQYGPFTDNVIVNYTRQILAGLAYLHDNQILHRDLKGANLLVDGNGHHLRIGDFGVATKLISHATGEGEFKGQLLGTVAFMAPEVLRGEDYGRSCDVWSVGCVMIEMATAKPPWNTPYVSNNLALVYKIASSTKPPAIPENLTDLTRDLALRCLELNSEDRLPAKELLNHECFCILNR